MTTPTDLNEVLNIIKIRFRYFEWKLLTTSDTEENINECLDQLIVIKRELNCILNLDTLSNKDKITINDYLSIIYNIIVSYEIRV